MRSPEDIQAPAAAAAAARRPRRWRLGLGGCAALVVGALLLAMATLAGGGPGPRHSLAARLRLAVGGAGSAAHLWLPPVSHRVAALEAQGDARIRELARLGKPIFCGGARGRALAFTFDDGPDPYTHLALRKLAAAHERATFFVVAQSMRYYPGYLRPELRVGAVGDHTYTHADLAVLPRARVYSEIARARGLIGRQSGQPVELFRPPYGALDPTVLRVARQLGLLTIMWTQDSGDSLGANYAGIIRNVERALRPGAIILMHENRGQTIRALSTLLPVLRRRHLHSVSLPELMATDPPSVAQVRRGSRACGRVRISAGSS
jgi:peptidoglycan/xylan/chitin deacetylase (PgdA/CDA1 family)